METETEKSVMTFEASPALRMAIQEYADRNCEGKYGMAIRELCRATLGLDQSDRPSEAGE